MTVVYLGGLSVGVLVPTVAAANLTAQADLSADLSAKVAIGANLDVALAAPELAISGALSALASGSIAASLAAATPLSLAAALNVSASANVEAIAALNAKLTAALELAGLLATAGVHAYAFAGTVGSFSSQMAAQTDGGLPGGAGPGQPAHALTLITADPVAWAALGGVLKTS